MVMKRGRVGDLGLEVLPLLDKALPKADGEALLRDRHEEAVRAISESLHESLGNVSRLRGWQVQYAFEAVVVALGAVRLIKSEDAGIYYLDDEDGNLQPPDFRVVLRDGTHLLVEVKSVPPGKTEADVRAKDVSATQAYAKATGARLMYALFWSGGAIWNLIDPSVFSESGTRRKVGFPEAMKANEMALLGDAFLASEPPLTFSLIADMEKERHVEPCDDGDAMVRFTVGKVQLLSAGRLIEDSVEQNLAWFLLLHGGWAPESHARFDDSGRLVGLDFVCNPEFPDEESAHAVAGQGFAIFGALSTLYSYRFILFTNTEEGDIRALREEPEPSLIAKLIPDDYWGRQDHVLRLWRFEQRPA